jgi:adenosine kinase
MNKVLVCGTLAVDFLSRYPDKFSALPTGTALNFSMQIEGLRREFGGCAMNICYSLKLLGDHPLPFVVAARDFHDAYEAHLARLGIDTSGVRVLESADFSPHAFIFTDESGNQLTGFYSGPSDQPDEADRLARFVAREKPRYAVLAPDLPEKQIRCARVLRQLGVPFLCDPGQCLTDFSVEQTRELIASTRHLVLNRYEWATVQARLGLDEAALVGQMEWVVVTSGAAGATWQHADGRRVHVPAVAPRNVVDPTGCGDADCAPLRCACRDDQPRNAWRAAPSFRRMGRALSRSLERSIARRPRLTNDRAGVSAV